MTTIVAFGAATAAAATAATQAATLGSMSGMTVGNVPSGLPQPGAGVNTMFW